MKEISIGGNKFVYDGKTIRVYDETNPSHDIIMTKEELLEVIAMNEFLSGMGDYEKETT